MNQNEALVKSAIHDAVIRAVTEISADVKGLLKDALARETNETAQSMLRSMVDNLSIAKEGDKAVCQSPGYPTTWLSFGDGNLPECTREAISEAVAEATHICTPAACSCSSCARMPGLQAISSR